MPYSDYIKNEYFDWLYNYVCKGRVNKNISYRKLFVLLYDKEFNFIIPNDINRARDGVDLRYRFSLAVDDGRAMEALDGPCSVLEMMVALAIRCEESIMDDPQYGDRTSQWFWNMISNLGISSMTDDNFDEEFVKARINTFLYRQYKPNGKGGLFYIKDCPDDLRDVEIWDQLCWYLNKIY